MIFCYGFYGCFFNMENYGNLRKMMDPFLDVLDMIFPIQTWVVNGE